MHTHISDRAKDFLEKKYRYSKSFHTKRSYGYAVNKFETFVRRKYGFHVDELFAKFNDDSLDPITILDAFFTDLSKEKLQNSSIRIYVSVAKDFLNSQGLHIYSEDIKQRFRLPRKENVYEEGLTKEILVRILHNSPPKLQTAILICISSGMRISELVQLRTSDIDFTITPTTIRIRKETTKTRETRFTSITAEATKSLQDYLRKNFGWNETSKEDYYIFLQTSNDRLSELYARLETCKAEEKKSILSRIKVLEDANKDRTEEERYFNAVNSARATLEQMLTKVIDSVPELSKKNENGRNSIHFHAFRAWFKTQVTNAHQSDFAEALMGHKSLKLVYFRQNAKDRSKVYLEVEPSLTVSDFTKVEESMEEMRTKIDFLTTELDKVKQWKEMADKYRKITVI